MVDITDATLPAVRSLLRDLTVSEDQLARIATGKLIATVDPMPAVGRSADPSVASRHAHEAAARRSYRLRIRTTGSDHDDLSARVSEVRLSESVGRNLTVLVEPHPRP